MYTIRFLIPYNLGVDTHIRAILGSGEARKGLKKVALSWHYVALTWHYVALTWHSLALTWHSLALIGTHWHSLALTWHSPGTHIILTWHSPGTHQALIEYLSLIHISEPTRLLS